MAHLYHFRLDGILTPSHDGTKLTISITVETIRANSGL